MKIYHGSDTEIETVDLGKCMPYKDFGKGFYTTVLPDQAWRMAKRKAALSGKQAVVTVFEIPNDLPSIPGLRCKVFDEKPTVEWATFVRNNRDRKFTDIQSPDCNLDGKYDVVIGPVANDTIGLLIRQFNRGVIDLETMKREFEFGHLTNQYTFHTSAALRYLRKVGVLYDE